MRRRMLLVVGAMAVIGCAALVVLLTLPPRPGITQANYDRIELGMTWVEVEQRFGEKGRLTEWTRDGEEIRQARLMWEAEDGSCCAVISIEDDRVIAKSWWATESFLNKIRRWLRL